MLLSEKTSRRPFVLKMIVPVSSDRAIVNPTVANQISEDYRLWVTLLLKGKRFFEKVCELDEILKCSADEDIFFYGEPEAVPIILPHAQQVFVAIMEAEPCPSRTILPNLGHGNKAWHIASYDKGNCLKQGYKLEVYFKAYRKQ